MKALILTALATAPGLILLAAWCLVNRIPAPAKERILPEHPIPKLKALRDRLGARGAWYLWTAYRWSRGDQPWGEWSERGKQ